MAFVVLVIQYVITAVGIAGNSLVILSISRQGRLLTNNYYYVVLHLALCDLLWLLVHFVSSAILLFSSAVYSSSECLVFHVTCTFIPAGVCMMLIISYLRYRAVLRPFEPAVCRRKLRIACGLVYVLCYFLFSFYRVAYCLVTRRKIDDRPEYNRVYAFAVATFYTLSTSVMILIYYKISRGLYAQSEAIRKSTGEGFSNSWSALNIQRYARNRKTFVICLLTVVFFALGSAPVVVFLFLQSAGYRYSSYELYECVYGVVTLFRLFGSHSVNPFIYGVMDKKLRWRRGKTKKRLHDVSSLAAALGQ